MCNRKKGPHFKPFDLTRNQLSVEVEPNFENRRKSPGSEQIRHQNQLRGAQIWREHWSWGNKNSETYSSSNMRRLWTASIPASGASPMETADLAIVRADGNGLFLEEKGREGPQISGAPGNSRRRCGCEAEGEERGGDLKKGQRSETSAQCRIRHCWTLENMCVYIYIILMSASHVALLFPKQGLRVGVGQRILPNVSDSDPNLFSDKELHKNFNQKFYEKSSFFFLP